MSCCRDSNPDGLWRDIYGDPVRPRRNGYAWPPDFLQIASWAYIFIVSLTHFLVEVPYLEGSLFVVVLVISLVVTVSVVALKVTLEMLPQEDPSVFADGPPRLEQEDLTAEAAPEGEEPCVFCRRFVQEGCKHCSVCDKCVPGFDHHCRWLNTCVGTKNYSMFATFMGLSWIGMAWIAGFSIWFAQDALRDIDRFKQRMRNHAYHSNTNAFPAIMFFVFLCLALTLIGIGFLGRLISFHIYLRYTHKTTYEYLLERRERKRRKGIYVSSSMKPRKKGLRGCMELKRRRNFKKHSKPPIETASGHLMTNENSGRREYEASTGGTSQGVESRPDEIGMSSNAFDNHDSKRYPQPGPLYNKKQIFSVQEECPNFSRQFSREPLE
ncbi:unnamed protein product [Phytomonas sp. EM1]|nr:unnamed protein product [Phytomonas sp. EM1]|eukprot:CCW61978.1 unnamed protein product [Phytomonas sp. isolate EM1]